MMVEIHDIIREQGGQVDSIRKHVAGTGQKVGAANKILEKSKKDTQSVKKAYICIIVTLVVIFLVVLIPIIQKFAK